MWARTARLLLCLLDGVALALELLLLLGEPVLLPLQLRIARRAAAAAAARPLLPLAE